MGYKSIKIALGGKKAFSKDSHLVQVKNTKVREIQLGCVKPPRNEERRTGEPCGPLQVGEIVELGYKEEFSFQPVLSLCHEVGSEQTYYTQHTLRGSTLQFNSIDQERENTKFKSLTWFVK